MNLLRAASTVSLFTLASKITGLVRDTLVAAFFGASAWTDAYNVAFRIPNLLRRLFAEGAFSAAFVPILGESRARAGDEATRSLVDAVATVLMLALVVTCVLGVVGAPVLVYIMAAGLRSTPEAFDAAVVMTRFMFPYIGFMSLVALAAGILNTWKKFVVPAATPVLLNVAMILAAGWLAPQFERWDILPIYAMAAGVVLGGILQLAVQFPALAGIGMLPRLRRPSAAWQHEGVRRVLKQMAPAVLGVSVAQLSLLINTQIASFLGPGTVSWLFYADRLMEFPTGLLGVALGVVLLPQLSAARALRDDAAYSGLLDWGLRLVVLLALPSAVALVTFAEPLVATVFHYGAFDARDLQQTVVSLRGYGVGLLGLIAIKVLAPGFYAKQDTRTPVRIAVIVLCLTQLMNLVFVPLIGHAGLALSIGLAALVNAGWLLWGLRRRGSYVPAPGWWAFLFKAGFATAVLGAGLAWASRALDWAALGAQPGLRIVWLALIVSAGALLYFALLLATGVRPRQFMRRAS
ncbi:murein biosynthesis integral membrane protein MurJ [Aquabacterium sp. A7-Y]|uniref:murein biosynthesis integral membrane protein MurJ n=1 Tax=Aquabacterium sp. A7-Y TaxID=1349605 RepID=UPI00223E2625|nr:murein biosynthesis integral membrane protein MurJ [Aquabacterium sp. A7-Y]MCW7536458.1 murein biosynthesis integral membrane protein MurJ [Aquabacterium sp. A7-Y]